MARECEHIHLLRAEWMSLPDHEAAPLMFDDTYDVIYVRRAHIFLGREEPELTMNFHNNVQTSLNVWDIGCSWTT